MNSISWPCQLPYPKDFETYGMKSKLVLFESAEGLVELMEGECMIVERPRGFPLVVR